MTIDEDAIQRWREILAKIDLRLSDAATTREQIDELKAIRAKLKIMGPGFLNASLERLRGMFDKGFL